MGINMYFVQHMEEVISTIMNICTCMIMTAMTIIITDMTMITLTIPICRPARMEPPSPGAVC